MVLLPLQESEHQQQQGERSRERRECAWTTTKLKQAPVTQSEEKVQGEHCGQLLLKVCAMVGADGAFVKKELGALSQRDKTLGSTEDFCILLLASETEGAGKTETEKREKRQSKQSCLD